MTNHRNDERTMKCPVEGCDATPLARGVNLHINRSDGDGHGPRGEVPAHISLDDLETVGAREVEMDYLDERNTEGHARLCPYCNQTFAGEQGLMIHLGQTAGRKNHPANPKDRHEPGDFPRVEVDADGNIQQAVETVETTPIEGREKGVVPIAQVFNLIAGFVADGELHTAQRIRRGLLGDDTAVAPGRGDSSHSELFEALILQGRAGETPHRVTTALEGDALMIGCRGESGFLTADEARDMAARLEQVAASEGWRDETARDLLAFLRRGADVLDGEKSERELHDEFDSWR